MIIFDLDGTLADCSHRRHFVDPRKAILKDHTTIGFDVRGNFRLQEKKDFSTWKPDWKAFYEACDKDTPIWPTVNFLRNIIHETDVFDEHRTDNIQIWSGRCESVREKTLEWLAIHLDYLNRIKLYSDIVNPMLKMRPIGDYTPDDQLKEKWLDEAIAEGKTIDMVFDDRKKVIDMWVRRGIFVFDVSQGKGNF